MRPMRVDVVGGGPSGLYAATLIKRLRPSAEVTVSEQNAPEATFGFGVVFSDQALDFLRADDPETHALITPMMERWRNMTLVHRGEPVTLDGVGFSAIGRLELIKALRARAEAVGVVVRHNVRIDDLDALSSDLVVGADGLNSRVRQADEAAFRPTLEHYDNRFAWFGADRAYETLTQTFVATEKGALNAHHYRFKPDASTFIVECDAATFDAYGFSEMDEAESAAVCAEVFADTLEGARLLTNRSIWRRFPKLWCENWVAGNRALLGDAVHTAHFSIGSGTRLAMEDAIALARAVDRHERLDDALAAYQAERQPVAKKIVDAANASARWYEAFGEKMRLTPLEFAHDYLQRSGRIDGERLRRMSPEFMAAYDAAQGASA